MPAMRSNFLLPLLILVSAAIAIASLGGLGLSPDLGFAAKPLTTVLILLWAWPRGADSPKAARWLRWGLVFSLGGDVALLWPEAGFLPGLVSFLIAHLCYIVGYCQRSRFGRPWWPFLLYALVAAAVLHKLWPGIPGDLRIPVLVYVGCLASMASQAWAWWRSSLGGPDEALARRAAWGGTLFLFSDAMIAINKFAFLGQLPHATLLILSTYWLAQCCFVASLRPAAPEGTATAP